MLLGPVFRAELVGTPRRRRYYALRVIYGSVLLLIIWGNYAELNRSAEFRGAEPSIDDFANFALTTFIWFASVQLATILFLVPALFGGVIADEKQRKTMHYLMASRLSSAEIVLDKLAARMLHVGTFVLLGLPVICLLTLFGGVAWDYVVIAYLATFSITFFAASLAVLVSTFARRVRQGVLVTYVIIIAWLIVPPVADGVCSWLYPNFYQWFRPVNEWMQNSGPIGLTVMILNQGPGAFIGPRTPAPSLYILYFWMVGLQLGAAVIFILIAAWRLRPVFRRQEESPPRLNWFAPRGHRPRWLNRPQCGSDAMLWKERFFARTDIFTKLVLLPATILLTVFVIFGLRFDETVLQAFADAWARGYTANNPYARDLHDALCIISPLYISIWLLAAAGASASSVAFEREQDTWGSLIATPLSPWQIVRGKSIGALWSLRGFAALLGTYWVVGLAAGAIHPFGLMLALTILAILTWFVVALGLHASLLCKRTSRALTASIAILMGLNVGYLAVLICILAITGEPEDFPYAFVGCTPWVASNSLLSYAQFAQIFDIAPSQDSTTGIDWRGVSYAALVILAYGFVAALLTLRTVLRFNRVIDRPRMIAECERNMPPERPIVQTRISRPASEKKMSIPPNTAASF
jgi:ABC-type transport system involved in multi-copper enzyme maturation permease subunit